VPNLPQLTITVYPNRYATDQGVSETLSWSTLTTYCAHPEILPDGGKDRLSFWHGAHLRPGGRRCNADVLDVSVLFLDIDPCAACKAGRLCRFNAHAQHKLCGGLAASIARIRQLGITACAFPSPSGAADRGRILIPLARPVAAQHYVQLWRIVNMHLGGTLDRQTSSPSHGYYTPAIADTSRWYLTQLCPDGTWLDPYQFDLADPDKPIRAPTDHELAQFDHVTMERAVSEHARTLAPAQAGERHGALFRLAQYCRDYALSIDRTRSIVMDYNATCNPPERIDVIDKEILSNIDLYRRNAVGCAIASSAKIYRDHTITNARLLSILAERADYVYEYGGRLCELTPDDEFAPMERPRLHSLLTHFAHCFAWKAPKKEGDNGYWERTVVPQWVAEEILSMPVLPSVRTVRGAISAPAMRSDGTILATPGYDRATRSVYLSEHVEIPASPTRDDAVSALAAVEHVFRQFPWDGRVSRTVYTAYLLTAVARDFLDGPAPIGVFDATKKQSGKSMLADCISIIQRGRRADGDRWSSDDDRMNTKLHNRCAADGRFVLFDNVRNGAVLESAALDGALTKGSITERRYFTQQPWDVPFHPIVVITGNGLSIGGDLAPRALFLRLTPPTDAPEERTDLAEPQLFDYVQRHRLQLCGSLLTVWRAWLTAGRPGQVKPWATVAGWTPVRQVLTWLGRPDPAESRRQLIDRDAGHDMHRRMLDWIAAHGPILGNDLLTTLQPKRGFAGAQIKDTDERAELWAAICHEAQEKGADVDVRKLGWILRRLRDAVLDGRALRRDDKGRWLVDTAATIDATPERQPT
jgi:hypothetical protein